MAPWSPDARLVVVGASLAGLRAAQACRAAGHTGPLTIVGAEPERPYNRPPLSKQLLSGAMSAPELAFDCGELEADWVLGTPAVGLDPEAHRLELGDRDIVYDRLIVATGTRARGWPGAPLAIPRVMSLRTIEDSLALARSLRTARRLTIVGAGFIGCEVAATARALGVEVTLVDLAPTPLAPLGPLIGGWCAALHRDQGVDLELSTGVESWSGGDRDVAVTLANGRTVRSDVAVLALGAAPCGEWLGSSGLALERASLVCDRTLTSVSDPDILGAGDVVSWPHPLCDGGLLRVEHWSNAVEQGTHAGKNALLEPDERTSYQGVPAFWSDQYGHRLQSVGLPGRADAVEIVEGSLDENRFVAEGYRDGRLIAAISVNAGARLRPYRAKLTEPRGEPAAQTA